MTYLVESKFTVKSQEKFAGEWIIIEARKTETHEMAMRAFKRASKIMIDVDHGMANIGRVELHKEGLLIASSEVRWLA